MSVIVQEDCASKVRGATVGINEVFLSVTVGINEVFMSVTADIGKGFG